MNILIIGGTRFVGYYLTQVALQRGHTVTLFNRGQSNPDAFPDVETIIGDRNTDLGKLDGRTWDAVIDTCGYTTAQVQASVAALRDKARVYQFVSTISVYENPDGDESAVLAMCEPDAELSGATYGGLKVHCENAVMAGFPTTHLITRPGLIVGPKDPTHRFGYWLQRIAAGGDVLAPEPKAGSVQVIDVRDLAAFTIHALESATMGIYNTVGPAEPLTMEGFLTKVVETLNPAAKLVWVSGEFLAEQGVEAWSHLPLWLPAELSMAVSSRKAELAGLSYRPLAETIRDGLAWQQQLGPLPTHEHAPISREREGDLLKAWAERS